MTAKPTVSELGIDLAAQAWQRSGQGEARSRSRSPGAPPPRPRPPDRPAPAEWVLLRVAGDPEQRVLVFDRYEWECFLDGARNGEFDDAAAAGPPPGDHY